MDGPVNFFLTLEKPAFLTFVLFSFFHVSQAKARPLESASQIITLLSQAEFLVISRTPHTLSIEAKCKNNDLTLANFLLRINIYIDAKLAEVISYQQEKPVPFFSPPQFSQSQDEKYQQNRMLTEWLENISSNGAVEAKKIIFFE